MLELATDHAARHRIAHFIFGPVWARCTPDARARHEIAILPAGQNQHAGPKRRSLRSGRCCASPNRQRAGRQSLTSGACAASVPAPRQPALKPPGLSTTTRLESLCERAASATNSANSTCSFCWIVPRSMNDLGAGFATARQVGLDQPIGHGLGGPGTQRQHPCHPSGLCAHAIQRAMP